MINKKKTFFYKKSVPNPKSNDGVGFDPPPRIFMGIQKFSSNLATFKNFPTNPMPATTSTSLNVFEEFIFGSSQLPERKV